MDAALACLRFAHFIATMFLFGASLFLWAFTPARLRAAIAPRLKPAAVVASLVALASALVWLSLEAASMSEDWRAALDPETVSDVLTSTTFGAVWLWRAPLLFLLVLVVSFTPAGKPAPPTLLAALALGSLALVDHASMQEGALGIAHRVNDALHLLTTGGWLGGLPPFALCLLAVQGREHRGDADTAMLRYSAVGHFAVVLIFATGVANIALTGGKIPWPPSSPYRALLSVKIAVVAVMIALAIVNRYVLLPALDKSPMRRRALVGLSVTEFALAAVAVGLVSYFGLLDPA
jgi:putative copper resistance protein D